MGFKHIELTLDQLLLDRENPRLGLSESDDLLALFEYKQNHLRNLTRSIAEEGLDPGDSFYVIESSLHGGFTVLDGNRRLAVLLLLTDPEVLSSTEGLTQSTRQSLVGFSAGFDRSAVEPVRCVLFDSREAAAPWIRRRHTGAMDGEGRVRWNTVGVQRASGDDVVADVVRFLRRNAGFPEEKGLALLEALMKGKATTFKRLLDSARGRQFLGLGTETVDSHTRPFFEADPNRVLRALVRIVDDLLEPGKANTRTLHGKEQIDRYFAGFPSELHPVGGETQVRHSFRDYVLDDPPPPESPRPKPPPKKKPADGPRTKLAPPEHEFDTSRSEKFAALVREAEKLSIRLYPLASSFLLRTIVALAVNRYMRDENLPTRARGHELSLERRARAVAQDIVDSKKLRRPALQEFRTRLLGPDSPCSIQSLNGFVHNERAIPTAADLRVAWDAAVPLFIVVYGKV